ncbi:MAG: hypothetical protein H7Z75_23125 [Ferruginibacter sp.]|nr:hypothetical protein [Cytophagales bacterium]
MIFLIDKAEGRKEVTVYESLDRLSSVVEWPDIFEALSLVIDQEGTSYAWDNSKKSEYGTVYGYTFEVNGSIPELAEQCYRQYLALGKPTEFGLS